MHASSPLIINIRCHNSFAKGLESCLAASGWPVKGLKPFSKRCQLFEIIILVPEHISPMEAGSFIDETLTKLQNTIDLFVKEKNIAHGLHPVWQTKRGGVNGYADWEQEISMLNPDDSSTLLQKAGIRLVTGWAFGNGSHPSTTGCAKALEQLYKQGLLADRTVLDIGTGTGILSLLAASFGASEIIALDIDPESVNIARLNVQQNGLDNHISVYGCSLSELTPFSADIITANLTPSVMYGNFSHMKKFIGKKTAIVAGGFKSGKQSDINALFKTAGCRVDWSTDISGWLTVIYKLK